MNEPYRFWGDGDKSYYEILRDRWEYLWENRLYGGSFWYSVQEFVVGRYNTKYWDWKRRVKNSIHYIYDALFHDRTHIILNDVSKIWWDTDHLVLHANFQLLVDFIEKEKPDETVDWSSDEHHAHAWAEMTDLYNWWTYRRKYCRYDAYYDDPRLESPEWEFEEYGERGGEEGADSEHKMYRLNYVYSSEEAKKNKEDALRKSWELEEEWEREDTENLIRLIKIRGYMWT